MLIGLSWLPAIVVLMRNPTIDVIRGIGIALVVLGHVWRAPELLRNAIYAFHMPFICLCFSFCLVISAMSQSMLS